MNKLKNCRLRIFSSLLAFAMLPGLFAGCGNQQETGTQGTTPPATAANSPGTGSSGEQISFTYFVQFSSPIIQTLAENDVYQELEKRTNVKIEFIHPSGDAGQALQLLLASQDIPDIIEGAARSYPGGPDKAISDGVYLRLNELIEQYAPNFKALRESNPEIARQTIADSGNIWAFSTIQTMDEPPWTGLRIRKDWLDELSLEVPTTVDELHTVLKAFKDIKNVESPLLWWDSWMDEYGIVIGAWDIGNSFYQVDGQVLFAPLQPAYKDYIETMRTWYNEGLLDKEFATRNEDGRQTLIANGKAGVYIDASDPEVKKNTVAVPYVTLEKGAKRHFNLVNPYNKGGDTVITTACKYPEEAVKWFDYHYSDEAILLFNYGIEGKSYTLVDGQPQFTELMLKSDKGYSATDLAWVYKLHGGPYKRDFMAFPGMDPKFIDDMKVWGDSVDGSYVLPSLTLNSEEGTENSEIMNEINTFIKETTLKFIMGIESMDKYDAFVEQIKKMNIQRAVEIQQNAFERYNSRD